MSFQEFLEKWNGKYVDYDGAYGGQCVDLARQYIWEVLNFPASSIKPVVGAKDMYEKYDSLVDKNYFDRIPNTPTGLPVEGDIILWGNSTYGHVAIYVEGDVNKFRSFDQNYPTGTPCHIQEHTYKNVLGWLRAKKQAAVLDCDSIVNPIRLERDRNWNWFIAVCEALKVAASVDQAVAEAKKLIELEDKYNKKDRELNEAKTKIAELESKITNLSFEHTELVSDYATLQEKVTDYEKRVEDQGQEIKSLSASLQELKTTSSSLTGWELITKGLKKLLLGGD